MFYGWKIVGVSALSHSISVGFVFYSYGVFLKALAEEFGGGRFEVSFGLTMMNIAIALISPFLGHALDHRSIKKIMCLGACLMGIGFFLASQITALWQLYVVFGGVLGFGAAMMGGLTGSKLVVNWFTRRRGMALGIATMGVSFSGVIMGPIATKLIAAIGWRHTFMIYGCVIIGVVVPVAWRYVVNHPQDIGLNPDGDPGPPPPREVREEAVVPVAPEALEEDAVVPVKLDDVPGRKEWSAREAIRDGKFWTISILFGVIFFSMSAMLTHLIPHGTDLGYSPEKAAFLLSATAGMAVVGKFVFGYIADHLDTRIALWLCLAFQATGTFLFIRVESYPLLIMTGGCFGFGMGGVAPLWRLLVVETFGAPSFGRVMGIMNPCMLPIRVAGVPFAGWIFDRTGSYGPAFQTFVCLYIVAACMTLLVRRHWTDSGEDAPVQDA